MADVGAGVDDVTVPLHGGLLGSAHVWSLAIDTHQPLDDRSDTDIYSRHGEHTPTVSREPTYFILASLIDGPLHEYGIIKQAELLSDGRVRLAAGTLYGAWSG